MYLLDTNIISELVKPDPNEGVILWAKKNIIFCLSVVTIEEILYGLSKKPNKKIQSLLEEVLSKTPVLPITKEIAYYAGKQRGTLAKLGSTRTQADMLISASAILNNLTLVTRNVKDFSGTDTVLLNPFS